MDTGTIAKTLGPRFERVAEDGSRALRELALPAGAAVLDAGTGSGNCAVFLALEGFRVVTGEPNTDQSQYAGRDWAALAAKAGVAERIRFESFDAGRMPFEPGSFAAVFFFGVLHHIDEGVRADVMREALRVVAAGGAVVFLEPQAQMLETVRADDPGHPEAANPGLYLRDASVREQRIQGSWMDIFIYRKAGR